MYAIVGQAFARHGPHARMRGEPALGIVQENRGQGIHVLGDWPLVGGCTW